MIFPPSFCAVCTKHMEPIQRMRSLCLTRNRIPYPSYIIVRKYSSMNVMAIPTADASFS